MNIHADSLNPYRIWHHQLLPVGIYRGSKNRRPKMPHPMTLFALSIMQCSIEPNAVSKASSNFSSKKYRQRFGTKRRGVSYSPTLWWASCLCSARSEFAHLGLWWKLYTIVSQHHFTTSIQRVLNYALLTFSSTSNRLTEILKFKRGLSTARFGS